MAKDILFQAAAAGVAFLKAQAIVTIPKTQIYPGIRHEQATSDQVKEQSLRRSPRVEVIARLGDPQTPHFRGNWKVTLRFNVVSNLNDTTDAQHQARVEEIFSLLETDTIAADLSAAITGFFVPVVVLAPSAREQEVQGKLWIDSLTLELREACVSDLV